MQACHAAHPLDAQDNSTMATPLYASLDAHRGNGRLPVILSAAALLLSLAACFSVLTSDTSTRSMVTMNTRSELLVAVPHAAHRAAGGRSHPQQLQLEHVGSQHSQAADVTPTAQAALQQQAAAAAGPPCNTTAPATAPGQQDPLSGVKAQFLQQVLSLTNYSQLGSAPLLDPLVASKNYQQMQEVVQQQQTLFCRAQLQDLDVPGVAQVTAQGLNLHVYSHGDFISSSLLRSQNWENHVITQLQWAINQYKPDTGSGSGPVPLVVDIGSNVGWITFSAAKMGARVIAFEGMPMNQVLLRHSLCDNPELMPRISLFATGLGEANKDCTVVSSVSNTGNGNVICSADVQAAMMDLSTKEIGHHYVVRGTMSLRPLDDLLSEDVHLLKLDVEGFEESVLKGAKQLLSSKRVKYLITEANNNLRKREGCVEYVKLLYELGFDISNTGFEGPFLSRDVIYDPNAPLPSWDVFGVRRTTS